MLATVYSRTPFGIEAPEVTIDVHLSAGLPYWSTVGLPEVAVKESRDRVRSAILNSGFEWPPGRITVNLAPAGLPNEGGRFDLPIAIALTAAADRQAGHDIVGLNPTHAGGDHADHSTDEHHAAQRARGRGQSESRRRRVRQ